MRNSEATRAAILTAARDQFASEGYERATIRSIAKQAGIDPAMVMRYYGNKEKLFAAAAEFDLRLPDLTEVPESERGAVLMRHILDRWEADETLMALLRAAVTNQTAAERMRTIFAAQVGPALLRIADDPAAVPRRAGLLASQVLGFALCRYVLKFPPLVDLPTDEAVRYVGPTLQRYLSS
ncbi:TetR family transcriptional regulator [Actinocrispum wychmicini]|uniref:TetR family transcriptional regulator n=1 Tax=Actinocrispum wychmicini TaxID=1213861 RepID=A0A4R2JJN1_9PSEU|nr:TetR family transcriptional regulator [Actinocrispum wychmicini]TCO58702.1 TetR family transcriptional regulator [Actinocrispum wychmicini]